MTANIRVPATLDEFYIGLGKAILTLNTEQVHADSATLDALMRDVPDAHHTAAGKHWCSTYSLHLRTFAEIATLAQQAGATGRNSMMVNVVEDYKGCRTFLRNVRPRCFPTIIAAGMKLEGQPFQSFLALLVQLDS